MNTFRTLSESRSFISLWLLLLVLSTSIPICEAGSESTDAGTGANHHLHHSATGDEHGVESLHTDRTVHHCCSDLTVQANALPVAVLSSASSDIPVVLPDFGFLVTISHGVGRVSSWRRLQLKVAGLPVYLFTRRLRI